MDQGDERWLEIAVHCAATKVDFLSDLLLARGAVSVTMDGEDPLFENNPGDRDLWARTRVCGIFDNVTGAVDTVLGPLSEELSLLCGEFNVRRFSDQNWEVSSRERSRPIAVTERLWIVPSWHQPPDPAAINLRIDPGMAFGTGEHPTTLGCLQALATLPLADQRILDYGCGSAILAIAAAKLGAKACLATDIDLRALDVSRENIINNEVESIVDVIDVESADRCPPFDVVVANILARPLIDLAERLAALAAPDSTLVLSGLLGAQADRVRAAYQPWFGQWQRHDHDDWSVLVAVKSPVPL
ncbi:50S ribosomal protein L11 methyltransferase [Gammaproteobacteria bacterium]|nr:50S ribosomal protein L11 methyltransferase [Gammaproteobacteria bacterium]